MLSGGCCGCHEHTTASPLLLLSVQLQTQPHLRQFRHARSVLCPQFDQLHLVSEQEKPVAEQVKHNNRNCNHSQKTLIAKQKLPENHINHFLVDQFFFQKTQFCIYKTCFLFCWEESLAIIW